MYAVGGFRRAARRRFHSSSGQDFIVEPDMCGSDVLVIEAFGRALPGIAEATRVWRDFFPHTDEVYQFGHDFLRAEWAKA